MMETFVSYKDGVEKNVVSGVYFIRMIWQIFRAEMMF